MNKRIIAAALAGMSLMTASASAAYNKYNEEPCINLTNLTIEEAAAEMGITFDELKKEYELPEDMAGDTNETAAFTYLTVKNLAKLYGGEAEELLTEIKAMDLGFEVTADTRFSEIESKIPLKDYLERESDVDVFKAAYGLEDSVNGDTGFGDVSVQVYRRMLAQSGAMKYLADDPNAFLVMLNGKYVDFDVAPAVINDRTMVPLRGILEQMGAAVNWDGENKTVFVNKDDKIITLQIGQNYMFINSGDKSDKKELDAAAVISGDRTLVPLRAIAEAMDTQVFFNETTRTVVIH